MADLCVGIYSFDLGTDFYDKYIDRIRNINAVRLQEIAQKYLNWSDLTIVSAG
jgi:predicted Zn-dependent peptidase